MEDNSDFSNIIICVYSNTEEGISLAKGLTKSNPNTRNSWMAMYSYNSVEGEYFDDNPSGYFQGN